MTVLLQVVACVVTGDGLPTTVVWSPDDVSEADLTSELSERISSQRAFEVNSRALATSLKLLDTAYEII